MKFLDLFKRQASPYTAKRAPLAAALEPRMLFDGAVAATAADAAASSNSQPTDAAQAQTTDNADHQASDALTPPAATSDQRQEIVFVDGKLQDTQALIAGLPAGTEVVVLDSTKDGLQQIADYLHGREGIDAVHLLSHGAEGTVELGNTWLNAQNINQHSQALNAIGATLATDGDILIYGCDTGKGAQGAALLGELARLTQADVAASVDATGAASKGGDWVLESRNGQVASKSLQVDTYDALLAAPADENFDDNPTQEFRGTNTFVLDGFRYTITGPGGTNYDHYLNNVQYAPAGQGLGPDNYLRFDTWGEGATSIRIEVADGSAFRLMSLSFFVEDTDGSGGPSSTFNITPSSGSSLSYSTDTTYQNVDFSGNSNFYNITSVTFSSLPGQMIYVDIDDLNVDAPITNTAPSVANAIPNQNATEDAAFNFQFAANTFSDVDVGDTLTYSAQLAGGGALPAWLSFNAATRTFSGTPTNANVGSLSIDVIANDGNGGTVTDTFNITVANTNDAPTVANAIPNQNATEDAAFNFQFAANTFSDVDVGNTLTYSAQLAGGGALPAWLSFDPVTRTFSGTPSNADVGIISIDVIANDSNGGTATDTFNIMVANTNDAPTVANAIPNQNATEDAAFNFQFAANTFSDADGNTLTYSAQLAGGGALPAWLSFDPVTRTFSGIPTNADVGSISIGVIANDGNGATATDFFDITVANTNDAPTVANSIPNQNAAAGAVLNFQFSANTFSDVDFGDTLTYSAQLAGSGALPAWLSFDPVTRTFSGAPTNANAGTISIDVIADDGNGGTVTDTFSLTVERMLVATPDSADTQIISAGVPFFQSFVYDSANPTFTIDEIQLALVKDPSASAQTITVTLMSGAYNGTIIDTATLSSVDIGTSLAWHGFDFTNTVLTDNQLYFIKVESSSNDGQVKAAIHNSDVYASGSYHSSTGVADTARDLAFRIPPGSSLFLNTSAGLSLFIEGDNVASTPVSIDSGLTVTNYNSSLLSSATVSITTNFVIGQDVLGFTNNGTTMGDIAASYNSATGVLTLMSASGATAAQWQAALRSVTYSNTSDTPNTASRAVSFSLSDGNSSSAAATRGVTVAATNDAPVATVPSTINLSEDVTGALTGISFSDADAGSGTVTVALSVPSGSLSAISGGAVTVSGTSTAMLLSGSIANINAFIAGANVTFTPAANATGAVVVGVNISDNGLSGGGAKSDSDSFTVNVTPVNDAPSITAPGSISVNEDVSQPLTGISFSDIDAGSGVVSVTFSVASGMLSAVSASGVTVGGTASALTLTGTLANINAFVASGSVSFLTASNATSNVVLSLSINDGGNTGSGGNMTAATTVTLAVSAVNDAPINSVPAAQNMLQDGALIFSTSNGNAISISDVDAGGGTMRVTLTATNGLITLGSTSGLAFTVGSGAGDATMTFDGSIADINNALAGLTFAPSSGYFGSATLQITSNDLGLSGSGGAQTDTDTISIEVVQPNPVITSVTSGSADGSYKVGDTISISVTFDRAVNVDLAGGSPSLLLETGLVDRSAVYVSGSGSSTLTFAYVVQAGDQSTDLNYTSTTALSLNGALIDSTSLGVPAVITLPAISGGDSLASNANLVIDGIAPTITSVSVPANGTYVAGQNLDFTVNLSEAVIVDSTGGTPRIAITLEGGGTVFAQYLSGSGTNALVFRLTVSSGQLDTNGISLGNAIQANGGTLRDAVGNNASTILNNVGSTSGVRVDAVAPTVGSVSGPVAGAYNAGDTLTFVVNASEAVVINGTPRLALDIGGTTVFADYVAGSGTSTLVFQYTVSAGLNDANGIVVSGLAANGGTLQDVVGNTMNLALNNVGDTSGVIVDTLAPSPTGIVTVDPSPTNAGSVHFTVTFSEAVSGVDLSNFSLAVTGMASGSLTGLVQLDAQTYQVTASGVSGTGTLGLNLNTAATGIVDQAGNAITGGLTGAVYSVDRDAPTITSVNVPAGMAYTTGDTLTFVVSLNEVVQVNGTPRLALDIGGTTVFADYVAGSGTSTLVFQYTVQPGDNDANGIIVSSLQANGGSVRDSVGNDLSPVLNGIGDTSGVIVDTIAPNASATVAPLPTPGSVQYTVTFNENVTGVDLADFNLVTTGNVVGTLQSLAQVDGRTFLVTISNVAGSGSLTLGLNSTGTQITDTAGNPQVSALSAQTYSVQQNDGDPEFRTNTPVVTPPESAAPANNLLPSPPPPPFASPLIPPPLFEVPTLGSGIPTLGNIFSNQGALAPSFIAQVFGSSDGFGDGSGQGFLGFGGGDGGIFGSSSLSSMFGQDSLQESEPLKVFDGKKWGNGSAGERGGSAAFGAPTLGQQLHDLHESEQAQLRTLASAFSQIGNAGAAS